MNDFIELHEIWQCACELQDEEDENKTYSCFIKGKILINRQHISLIRSVSPLPIKNDPDFNQVILGDTMAKIFLALQKPQYEYRIVAESYESLLVAESYEYVSKLIKES